VRQPTEQELKSHNRAGAATRRSQRKVRTGGAIDDEEDYALPVWRASAARDVAKEPLPMRNGKKTNRSCLLENYSR